MKQRALLLTLAIATAMSVALSTAQADAPFVIPIVATDDSGNTRTVAIGLLATANACVDTADAFGGYQEFELPPVPPTNVFDARLDDRSGVPNTVCYGQGTGADFRPQVGPGQVDTFLVKTQDGTGGRPIHLSWPSGLSTYCDSIRIVDQFGGFLINVDMLATTNYDLTIGLPSSFYIIMYAHVEPNAPVYMTTLEPDSIISEDPLKPFKSKKLNKRFKGFYPNWSNLLSELVAQGGFAPGTSESDSAGGLRVGRSYYYEKDPVKKKWAAIKDSAAKYGWVKLGKYDRIKVIGKGHTDIQKSLIDKTGRHIGIARGLDSLGNPGDLKRKPILKENKKLVPKKQSNRLFAEMVALKVNIAASALGKTPAGFGELLYSRAGHPYDGMSLTQISAHLDSAMTYWWLIGPNGGGEWDSAYNCLYEVNRSCVGPLDTLSWEAGGELAKLTLAGNEDVNAISFFEIPQPFVPNRVTPANNVWESPDEFEDDEFEETDGVPAAMKLYQNYPNPFNPSTTIAFRLNEASNVTVKVFNLLGQEIATLLSNEELEEGVQTLDFSASALASGIYFYRVEGQNVETGEQIAPAVGKMMLLK